MTREEIKQYLRNQIDSSIKIQDETHKELFYLCYNDSYLRALNLSKITGQPVNKEDFNDVTLFVINTNNKEFWYYPKIRDYLKYNYSHDYYERMILVGEVLNEHDKYNDYKCLY